MAHAKGSPKTPGSGRKKGTPNRNTAAIKEMLREALDRAGGVEYLVRQAKKNPGPFLNLIGKLIPAEVNAKLSGPTLEELVRLSMAASHSA